jgi:hypothetical protein
MGGQCGLCLGGLQRHDGALRKADKRGVGRGDTGRLLQLLNACPEVRHHRRNASGTVFLGHPGHGEPLTALPEVTGLQTLQADHQGGWKSGGELLSYRHQVLRIGAHAMEQQDQLVGRACRFLDNN